MKYIDKNLSPENLALLNAWIDRRESRLVCPDARSRGARDWWNCQQAMLAWQRNPPPLQLVSSQQNAYMALQQSAYNAALQNSAYLN
jgi:hypothetical protein